MVRLDREFAATPDGGSELDAEAEFERLAAAVDAVLEKTKRRKIEITHVVMCSFWHSLVGVDADARPTTKVLGWADTRSRDYSAVLKARFEDATVHNRTGAHFHSSFWPPKLLWLRKECSDAFARTAMWLSFSDYVALKLFGAPATTVSMASGTGIFDQRTIRWDTQLLKRLKIPPFQLPQVAADDALFQLIRKYRIRWPRLANAKWFSAIGDGAADHIGSCGLGNEKVSLMVGTSAAMRIAYTGEPPVNIPDGLWCYRIDRQRMIIGGALSDGGNLYSKLLRELTVAKNAHDEMRRRGAAAHGLTVLPFFFGERGTGYREDARGAILGLIASHDAVDVLQAAMEGVAYRLAEIHDRLNRVSKVKEIVASGGALRDSPIWTQIIADVLGRDLTIPGTLESASRGAVLLALESLGKIESIDSLPSPGVSKLEHHPSCHKVYRTARKKHQAACKNQ